MRANRIKAQTCYFSSHLLSFWQTIEMDKVPLAKKSSRLGFPFFCCFDTNRQCAKKTDQAEKGPRRPRIIWEL